MKAAQDDRLQQHMLPLLRCIVRGAPIAVVMCLFKYVRDACMRMANTPDCKWHVVSHPDHKPYVTRYCFLTKETVLLRLYGVQARHLLAERAFPNSDWRHFLWTADGLAYDAYPDGDSIERLLPARDPNVGGAHDRIWYGTYPEDAYPPTLLDRLHAKLP